MSFDSIFKIISTAPTSINNCFFCISYSNYICTSLHSTKAFLHFVVIISDSIQNSNSRHTTAFSRSTVYAILRLTFHSDTLRWSPNHNGISTTPPTWILLIVLTAARKLNRIHPCEASRNDTARLCAEFGTSEVCMAHHYTDACMLGNIHFM